MVDDIVIPMQACLSSRMALKTSTGWGTTAGHNPMPQVQTSFADGAQAAAMANGAGKKTREDARGLAGCAAEPTRVQLGVVHTYLEHVHILAKAAAVVQREGAGPQVVATVLEGSAMNLVHWVGPVLAAHGAERAFLVADHDKTTASGYADLAFGSGSSRVGRDPTIAQVITAATAARSAFRLAKERSCAAVAFIVEMPGTDKPWPTTWAKPATGAAPAPRAA